MLPVDVQIIETHEVDFKLVFQWPLIYIPMGVVSKYILLYAVRDVRVQKTETLFSTIEDRIFGTDFY